MSSSADTKFGKCSNFTNACFFMPENLILVGKDTMTIETLVHEITEMDIDNILDGFKMRMPSDKIGVRERDGYKIHTDHVAHFMSPYGEDSLIYPLVEVGGRPVNETFLEE